MGQNSADIATKDKQIQRLQERITELEALVRRLQARMPRVHVHTHTRMDGWLDAGVWQAEVEQKGKQLLDAERKAMEADLELQMAKAELMGAHTHARTLACTHTCTHSHARTHLHACMHLHVLHARTNLHACAYTHVFACMHALACMHLHAHARTHALARMH